MGKQWKQWQTLFSWTPKSLWTVIADMKLKYACSLEEKQWQTRQHIKKQRNYFAKKSLYSQSYGFSTSHVWMWVFDYKESWAQKNWCFWTVVLKKTLESPLDCKEIQPVHSKGDQSWVFFGRNVAKAETPILWPPHAKCWLIGKVPDAGNNWAQEEKGTTEDEMAGWHHQLEEHEFEWIQELVMDKEAWSTVIHGFMKNRMRLSNWTELNWGSSMYSIMSLAKVSVLFLHFQFGFI